MKKTKILNIVLPIATLGLIIIVWAIAGAVANNQYVVPTIDSVFNSLIGLLGAGEFYSAYFSTLLRSFVAFVLSFALALFTAIMCKKFKYYKSAISPLIKIIRALPTIAVVLILVLFTNSWIAPVIVTMLVVFPMLFTNIKESLDSVDDEQIEMCKTFGLSNKEILFKVQIPQIAPSMLEAVGAGFSLNIKLMVAAEVLASTYIALGSLLQSAYYDTQIATMIALVVLCVITGLIIELIFGLSAKKVGKWK